MKKLSEDTIQKLSETSEGYRIKVLLTWLVPEDVIATFGLKDFVATPTVTEMSDENGWSAESELEAGEFLAENAAEGSIGQKAMERIQAMVDVMIRRTLG